MTSNTQPLVPLPDPDLVAPGLYRVPISIPVPLRIVNSYLIEGPSGWTVVDTGFHTPSTEQRWQEVLEHLRIRPSAIEQIVVTHYHPDHLGCAGWLQALTGAPVLMLEQERPQVERFWGPGNRAGEAVAAFFGRHGMPAELSSQLDGLHRRQTQLVWPLPRVRWIAPGDVIAVGRRRFHVIWAPGHTAGLMVLWEPEERLLLSDDLILAPITPNISLWPYSVENPLRQFLDSIREVGRLPARLVLPGHRQPIPDLAGRTAELARHHDERLRRVVEIVSRRSGRDTLGPTAWEVNRDLFGELPDLFSVRFAMGESLAHLEYLVEAGWLTRREADGVVRYALGRTPGLVSPVARPASAPKARPGEDPDGREGDAGGGDARPDGQEGPQGDTPTQKAGAVPE